MLRKSLADSEHISALLKEAEISADWESVIRRGSAGRGQRFVAQFEQLVQKGNPTLINCERVNITGKVTFAAGVVLQGAVNIVNESDESKEL